MFPGDKKGVRQVTHRTFGRTLTYTALVVGVVLWLALMFALVRAGLSSRVHVGAAPRSSDTSPQ